MCLLRVEEPTSALQRAATPDAARARQQPSGVAAAVGGRRHTSEATSGAQSSTARAARTTLRKRGSRRWAARGGVSCSMGCRSSQHDATARFCDGDEQRSHCIARPSDAVAALLTALAAVERCGAPHSWHDEEHAGCVPELAAVARRHEDVSRSHADSQESPPGRSRGTMARRERRAEIGSSAGH